MKSRLIFLFMAALTGCSTTPPQEGHEAATVPDYYRDKYATSPVQLLGPDSALSGTSDDPFDFSRGRSGGEGTLKEALSQLLPGNCWRTYITPGLQDEIVKWPAGVDFDKAITAIAGRYGLTIDVDRSKCLVTVDRKHDSQDDGRYYGIWRLEKGEFLSDALARWAEKANWGFEYHPEKSFVIDHPAVLSGPLEGPDGVLVTVVDSYRDSDMPLRAEFSTLNKVIHIYKRTTITSGVQR